MDKIRTMTNSEINSCIDIIQKILTEYSKIDKDGVPLLKKPSDPAFSYVLGRNLRILRDESSDYNEERARAVRNFGKFTSEDGSKGTYVIDMKDKDQVEAYENHMRMINNITHDVKLCIVPSKRMGEWELPLAFESALWFLIDEDELFCDIHVE